MLKGARRPARVRGQAMRKWRGDSDLPQKEDLGDELFFTFVYIHSWRSFLGGGKSRELVVCGCGRIQEGR